MTVSPQSLEGGPATELFAGPGEMRARCRAFDWSSTQLGPVSDWPASLRTIVATLLASRHPMFLWWGPELVQIFNDGYLPSFGAGGRDIAALGARGREHWAEIWDVIGPQIEVVMTRGEATWNEDHLVPITRNGRVEDVYWTYGYSPVCDDDGRIAGVLVVVQETTAYVKAQAERESLLKAEHEARVDAERARAETLVATQQLQNAFSQAPVAVAVTMGPTHQFVLANPGYEQLVGRPIAMGMTFREAVPEIAAQGYESLLDRAFATGAPFATREAHARLNKVGLEPYEGWYDFVYQPLVDETGRTTGVMQLGVDVTDKVHARRALEIARDEAEAARAQNADLLALARALSSASTPEEVASAAVTHAVAVFGATGISVVRVTSDGERLEIIRATDIPADVLEEWREIPTGAAVPVADVARTREPLFFESRADVLRRYPDLEPTIDATGHIAIAVAPLIVDGRLLGVLAATFSTPRAFTEGERALVLTVAAQCAQAFERARLYEAESAARREAELANRSKSEFLAVMSHELRTPLNAIGGYAELIELGVHGPVTDEQRTALARVQRSQRHLLGLINGVLNYSRIEAGAMEYDVADVAIDEVLSICEAFVAPQAREKRVTLIHERSDPKLLARGDREKIQQVVLNLLSNAVKFTNAGGTIRLTCSDARADALEIRVADTGRGIPAGALEKIFQPFVQVDAQLTRTYEGTGLGLAISRDLARGMGGDLTVESEAGAGSTFMMTIPRP